MNKEYNVEIVELSKELTKIQKVGIKDVTDCIRLDEAVNSSEHGYVKIDFDFYAVLKVHNERAKDDVDYYNYVVVDKDGTKYVTGSASFWNAFTLIYDELEDEDYSIKVYGRPSKNFEGKNFLTCTVLP